MEKEKDEKIIRGQEPNYLRAFLTWTLLFNEDLNLLRTSINGKKMCIY